jgi:hypothetical protein
VNRCDHVRPCKREGKVKHECRVEGCTFSMRACMFHRDACHLRMQEHVKTEHPDIYAHMRTASGLS